MPHGLRHRYARFVLLAVLLIPLGGAAMLLSSPLIAAPILAPAISNLLIRPDSCRDYGELTNGTYRTDLIHAFETGFVIAYSVTCIHPSQLATPIIGYTLFRREGAKIHIEGPVGSPVHPEQTFSFGGSHGWGWSNITGTTASAVFHGLIQSPSVPSIEITFADGSSMKTTGSGRRFVFAAFLPIEPCVLRSLGDNGSVLETFDLSLASGMDTSPTQGQPGKYMVCD